MCFQQDKEKSKQASRYQTQRERRFREIRVTGVIRSFDSKNHVVRRDGFLIERTARRHQYSQRPGDQLQHDIRVDAVAEIVGVVEAVAAEVEHAFVFEQGGPDGGHIGDGAAGTGELF